MELSPILDMERMVKPVEPFHLFRPEKSKLQAVAKHLMEDYLYLSDEYRNYDTIWSILNRYYSDGGVHLIYEIGEMDGLLGFVDVMIGWRANVILKLWEPKRWGPDLVRASRALIDLIVDVFKLRRLGSQTADPRIVKMAKMVGFQVEGWRPLDFKWDNRLFDNYVMGRVKED